MSFNTFGLLKRYSIQLVLKSLHLPDLVIGVRGHSVLINYLFFPASERTVILVPRPPIVRGEENDRVVVETLRLEALHDVPHGGVEGRDGGRPVPLIHLHGGAVLGAEL